MDKNEELVCLLFSWYLCFSITLFVNLSMPHTLDHHLALVVRVLVEISTIVGAHNTHRKYL